MGVDKPLSVERQLEIVTQQIIRAKIFYDIWWLYVGSESRPQIIETLDNFSEFFRFDEHAHFVSMIVHCAVVWDKRRDAVSLPSVAKSILDPRRNGDQKVLLDKIESYRPVAERLRTIRDKAIAHRSIELDYADAFKKAGVIPDCISTALHNWLDAVNALRTEKGMNTAVFAELPLEHARELIYALGGPNLKPENSLDYLFKK